MAIRALPVMPASEAQSFFLLAFFFEAAKAAPPPLQTPVVVKLA